MTKGVRFNMEQVNDQLLEDVREREKRLTPKRRRFIKEFLASPDSPKDAAIRAGFSPRSARVIAHRLLQDDLIQSELAKHFVDQEKVVSESLAQTLARLQYLIQEGNNKTFFEAAKLLLAYTKLAVPVLGLEIKRPKELPAERANLSVEELIAEHEREAERLRQLHTRGTEGTASEAGEDEVH